MEKGSVDELIVLVANLLKKENNEFDNLHSFHHQTNSFFFSLSPTISSTFPTYFHACVAHISILILHFFCIKV